MYKVGVSLPGSRLVEESFVGLDRAGIHNIELSMSIGNYNKIDYKEIARYAKENGVNLWSYHLPFGGPDNLEIATKREDVRADSIRIWTECIQLASEVGIDKFIAHPSSDAVSVDPVERAEAIKRCQDSLDKMAEIAHKYGATIAVEDLPRTCLGRTADEMEELLSVNDKLRVCFDTNHLLMDNNINFLEKHIGKIITTHVSDYDFINERHWLPGEGKVDWQELYSKLLELKYDGVWMYEISMEMPKTIIRERDITFEDFARNAKEIFENKPLTTFSKHKEVLGMWE